jgi:8-hydroxy-5-deazaflavin:NADPH oxidoreductase
MNIAIVGPGKLGSGLGKLWTRKGHDVYLTFSRDPAKLEAVAKELGAKAHAASPKDAVAKSEVVVLATKWAAVPDAITQAGGPGALEGKVILDCTNTMSPRKAPDGSPETRSCAEVLATMVPGARVVKTFNQIFEQILHSDSRLFGGQKPTMFHCGDDAEAKKVAARLIEDTDLEAVDAGPLENARYVEAYAVLVIRLGHTLGLGTNVAMKLMRR